PALHPAPGAVEGYGSPAGGLFSTAIDMRRFAQALLANRLTRAATTAALTEPQILAAPATSSRPERDYGFGFTVGTEAGRRWFGHNGGTLGANTEFAVFPKDQLVLTVLSNRDPPMASAMFAYLRKLVLNPSLRATCAKAGSP
ncbi:MAG: beta-lactamase family protein, partial [Pseudomonadota bacterium]|nr:beta-lactamase family protein [Pseudomonadota bacterium]